MTLFFGLLLIISDIYSTLANLTITNVVMRIPKENDIGLIFDICVSNKATDPKQVVEFVIRPHDGCYLNLTKNHMMCNAGRIVGANFGVIEPGTIETVSLIWPTISLYNRVGFCSIALIETKCNQELSVSKQKIHFDTRYETLDPSSRDLRRRTDYTDCKNWDKEYFKNCIPVNCEERYFGRRSYYNHETERCEEVTRCTQPYEIYDIFQNECIDTKHMYDEDEIAKIKKGNYKKDILKMRPTYATQLSNIETYSNEQSDEMRDVEMYDTETKRHVVRQVESERETDGALPYWMQGVANGLLIVFATIAIYVLICFIIFLIVSWISRRQSPKSNINLTASEDLFIVCSNSSLMSQR